jgi:hypothetical protein
MQHYKPEFKSEDSYMVQGKLAKSFDYSKLSSGIINRMLMFHREHGIPISIDGEDVLIKGIEMHAIANNIDHCTKIGILYENA